MILSILIPTLPERAASLARVIKLLGSYPEVEILTDDRGRHITTGEKRNDLIQRAAGEYVSQVDDDDQPQPDYINHLLTRINLTHPDCVTFTGWMTTDGLHRVDWIIKLGERYEARQGVDGITRYYRFPNHLCAIKKSIAQSVKFQHITQGEDFRWADEINKRGLIRTSEHIESPPLYYYDFRTKK